MMMSWWAPADAEEMARLRALADRHPRTPLTVPHVPIGEDQIWTFLGGCRRDNVGLSALVEAAAAEGVTIDRERVRESLRRQLLGRDLAILTRIGFALRAGGVRS